MFLKELSSDIIYSLSYGKYKWVAFFGLVILLSVTTSIQAKAWHANSVDVFFLLLKDNGYISSLSDYEVPYKWVFIQCFTLFLVSDFLSKDIKTNRIYLILRCQSKNLYILSKLIWIIIINFFLYVCLFLIVYFISGSVLGDLTIETSPYFHHFIQPLMTMPTDPGIFVFQLFFGFFLTTIVLSSIQLLFIQYVSPMIVFLGVIFLSVVSTLYGTKWLPAIHSMILKHTWFEETHHLTFLFSDLYSTLVFIGVAVITVSLFRNKDIL
jgi:hypothetical protein